MTSILRSILPTSSPQAVDHDDDNDYSVEYSFATQYSGPPVTYDIPLLVPLDVRRIPTAEVATTAAITSNLAVPVVHPIVRKTERLNKFCSHESKSGHDLGKLPVSERAFSRNYDNLIDRTDGEANTSHGVQSSSSSGTLGFSDAHDDSNLVSGSSDVEDLDDDGKAGVSSRNSLYRSTSNSIQEVDDEVTNRGNRTSVVTFRDLPSNAYVTSDKSDTGVESPVLPERRPVVVDDGRKGLCHKCLKKNRFGDKEVCIVCGAKYCSKCVLRAMGSMPEGRKCITCIGYHIDELNRGSLGKSSRMLKRLLTDNLIKKIMEAEMSCDVNQLPPYLICVNGKPLNSEELSMLQTCINPPKKLKPERYWYDKVAGFWGKEGEKPYQIISARLAVGFQISRDASNGHTDVLINNREITKSELWMLQMAGIPCEGNPHFWVSEDGSCQHEGMNNVLGYLWEKKRVRVLCTALSLPFLSDTAKPEGEGVDNDGDNSKLKNLDQAMMNKFLLVGCDKSGTSTIFKQARILYNIPFSDDEKQSIKIIIQRNVYRYIAIMLEARTRFEEDHAMEMRRKLITDPGPSSLADTVLVDRKSIYSFSPKLEAFSSWLLQVMMSGNLDIIFPAATREYSPLVEELWRDKAFQAIYKRRNELHTLPRVANYFLDRAVEISCVNYEPSEMDILYAEGVTSSNGIASMEFSFPKSSLDVYMEPYSDPVDLSARYQLIRVRAGSLGENGKLFEMFEDVDLVLYCVSMTDYDEYYEDKNGLYTNKMWATMKHFESVVTHPTFASKSFLLVLNKYDLLEEKIEQVPLSRCELFQDFNPVMSHHPHSSSSSITPLAQRAFHYIGVKFKRLFNALTERKLFVSLVTGLEADSIDKVLRYGKEILKWDDERERHTAAANDWSTTESIEPSSFV